jgi:hypothetical protein
MVMAKLIMGALAAVALSCEAPALAQARPRMSSQIGSNFPLGCPWTNESGECTGNVVASTASLALESQIERFRPC